MGRAWAGGVGTWIPEAGRTQNCEFKLWLYHLLTVTVWVKSVSPLVPGFPHLYLGYQPFPPFRAHCSLNAVTPVKVLERGQAQGKR